MSNTVDIKWVDEFIQNVKPYIFVRLEDNVLIKRPNQATKINATGAKILYFLLHKGNSSELLEQVGDDKACQIEMFLLAVKRYLEGNLNEFEENSAIERESFKKNFTQLPIISEFAINYKCNLKCQFCYAGCNLTTNPIESDKELSIEESKEIISRIYNDAKVPSISFTGGEPTLAKEKLLALVEYAKSLGMRVNLITNGTQLNMRYVRQLKDAGLDSAQVSLEGTAPQIHNKLTQKRGSFEKSIAAIGFFKAHKIHVHTNTTLNKHNIVDSLELPEFVKKVLDLDKFSMNLVIPTGSSAINSELVVPYSELGEIIKQIQQKSKENDVEFMWYSPIPMCMFNTITHELGNKGCSACDGLLSVAPNGDVLPCASYDEPVGNMLSNSFKTVWGNKAATSFRQKDFAHELCKKCDQFNICNGACPLYWRNQGYDELNAILEKINAVI